MQPVLDFFSNEGFMPHGMCLLWKPEVFWLHVVSDGVIALSYYSIPFALLSLVNQRRDLMFPWIFRLFGAFILLCGTTHALGIWVMWNPDYAIDGLVKASTAVVSAVTAILLWPLMPRALALPSTAQLKALNDDLAHQVRERHNAENALRRFNDELERRVSERTAELEHANQQLRDEIDRRHAVESQLVQAQKMEAIGQLTGGLAHDFNNLLAVIIGSVDALEQELTDKPQAQKMATRAIRAAERGAELNRKLLAFARRQPLQRAPINLNRLLPDAIDMLRQILDQNIELQLITGPALWTIESDAVQIETALTNLVVNARDAMPNGGRLRIEASNLRQTAQRTAADPPAGHYVVISIADTGAGMPREVMERAFEPFYSTKEGKGSGLGLSMVYGFITQSGGHVRLDSTPGQGTTVHLYLPRSETFPNGAISSKTEEGTSLAGLVVLLVEDTDEVRMTVRQQLEAMDITVKEAINANEAMKILSRGVRIDLLLTDMIMPGGMNGADLADHARRLRPGIKILLTSGYLDGNAEASFRRHQIKHILLKPYRQVELRRKLMEALETANSP